jgi:GNAT acetyltransferase-like protein
MASMLTPAADGAMPRSLAAAIEERLLVPTYSSEWAPATIAAHRGMALPFQLLGKVHRWWVSFHGRELRLAGIGRKKLIEPLYLTLFGGLSEPSRQARRMLWRPEPLAGTGADIVVAEVHRWMAPRFRRAGWVIVPEAVRWLGELSQVPPAEPCRSLKDDLRKVRKNGFTLSQSTAAEDWEEFYSEMVQPQARSRHGETAWVPSRRLMEQFAANGILHLISQSGVRVAGACSLRRGEHLWIPLMGIRHGDPTLLRQGAGNAALALTFEWARAAGYRWLDAGRTGPFINDGLQQSKRKWGLAPAPDPLSHVAAVWVGSDVARQAFSRQPVLVEDGTTLQVYAGEAM